jgi:hypothetical protein
MLCFNLLIFLYLLLQVRSRSYNLLHLGDSDSTASLEYHHIAGLQHLGDNGKEEFSYIDRSLHLTPTGRVFSRDISPRADDIMLEHTRGAGDGEAGGSNLGLPFVAYIGDSYRLHNWSAEAYPTAGDGRGGSTSAHGHTYIDIPAHWQQSPDFLVKQLRETVNKIFPEEWSIN